MKTLRILAILLALTGAAFAWPACDGNWVSVPKRTTGGILYSTGDLLFQCQPKTTSQPPLSVSSNSNSAATSNSSSSANSSSVSSATQKQAQQQEQTATGGNASASAANNGNNSNNSVTNVEASKIPVSTAYAPTSIPTVPCLKGYGGAVQTMGLGGSFGGGKVDDGCDARELARSYSLTGSRLAACKILVSTKKSKKAGVTLEDCMASEARVAPVVNIPPPPSPQPPQVIVVSAPPAILVAPLPAPPEYKTEITVTAPKAKKRTAAKTNHHMKPECQNVIQRVCK